MVYFTDPIIVRMRSGQDGDEYVEITEQQKIIHNKAWLTEIPVYDNKVEITGEGIIWFETREPDEISENEYYVDYVNGQVYFHPSRNGLTLTFKYMGKGA